MKPFTTRGAFLQAAANPASLRESAQRCAPSPAAPRNGRERLRVLHVLNRLELGGTELNVAKLVRGLPADSFEHQLCAVRSAPETPGPRWLAEGSASCPGAAGNGFQVSVARLARLMRGFRPHIVHSRNWGAIEAVAAARLSRVPAVIHSEHGYELDMLDGLPLRRRLFRRFSYRLADAVFAVTQELRDYHARQAWLSPRKLRVIYNGVDADRFQPRPELRLVQREGLGLPAESFVVGSVGRLVPIKDYSTLFSAVESLLSAGVDARVLLVGSGPELESLKARAASPLLAGRVVFAGLSRDVCPLLAAMDVFVLSSLREGMSNTLLEAMACGLPAIATRAGGNPEIVEDGRSGILVAPGQPSELAGHLALLAASSQLRRQLGTESRRRVLGRFTLARMLRDYEQLYREVAGRRGLGMAG